MVSDLPDSFSVLPSVPISRTFVTLLSESALPFLVRLPVST